MKEEKLLRKILADNRLKVTKPRLTVFHLLLKQSPKSVTELVEQSKGSVDRVSIYRVVDLFEKLGIARRVTIGWKYKIELSELFLEHHHHITCLGCGKVVAVHEHAAIGHALHTLAHGTGFTVTSHQLELQGYCEKCNGRRSRHKV